MEKKVCRSVRRRKKMGWRDRLYLSNPQSGRHCPHAYPLPIATRKISSRHLEPLTLLRMSHWPIKEHRTAQVEERIHQLVREPDQPRVVTRILPRLDAVPNTSQPFLDLNAD